MSVNLNTTKVTDPVAVKNFEEIKSSLNNNSFLKGEFKLVEGTITGNQTGITFKHGLKFTPKDSILTSAIWSSTIGVLTFKNDLYDAETITLKTTGLSSTETVKFRALVGRMDS